MGYYYYYFNGYFVWDWEFYWADPDHNSNPGDDDDPPPGGFVFFPELVVETSPAALFPELYFNP